MINLSLISTYKNRRHHIQQVLPTWIKQIINFYEIVIVDYDSEDDVTDMLYNHSINYNNIVHVKCRNLPVFHLSHARNIGSKQSLGNWFLFIDIDTKLAPNASKQIMYFIKKIKRHYFAATDSSIKKNIINGGLIAVERKYHDQIFGFNENIVGWGYEDIDYKKRLENIGLKYFQIPENLYDCIDHSDCERTQCYNIDKEISWTKNRQISLQTWMDKKFGEWEYLERNRGKL